ncbi:serine/threonine protein kinase [Candidatus Woesearchaeota archaeon]|nr:serine/threonine protein kinase [Candidatus Woesearchaeota archaeon]
MSEETTISTKLFDQYEMYDQIGQGGYGDVFLAKDLERDKNIALKISSPRFSFKYRERLLFTLQEGRALSKLRHKNIPELYSHGMMKINKTRVHYIAMELVPNTSLKDALKKGVVRHWSKAEKNKLLLDTARALAYAHEKGIIHGDVTPGNIACSLENIDEKATVIDWGLARFDDETMGNPERPKNTVWGTFGFMSLEQMQGYTPCSFASDAFSFGMTAFNLFLNTYNYLADRNDNINSLCCKTWFELYGTSFRCMPEEHKEFLKDIILTNPYHRPTMKDAVKHLEELVD